MEIYRSMGKDQFSTGDRSVWLYCARRGDPKGRANTWAGNRLCRTHADGRLVPLVGKKAICTR